MQTDIAITINPSATANITSPTQTPTQESSDTPPGTTTSLRPPDIEPDLLDIANDLAAKVRECQVTSLIWTIEAGVRLRDYRDSLEIDDWLQVLRSGRLPVGARTAQTLVRIARNKIIQDSKRTHQLPDSITILSLLAGLPTTVLERALDTGVIHPNTSLKEATQFVCQESGKSSQPTLSERRLHLI